MSNKLIDGVLIDCSRTMERHEYYFKLIDFMAEWGLNTLFFHFTDDHGCAVQLPGFLYEKVPGFRVLPYSGVKNKDK